MNKLIRYIHPLLADANGKGSREKNGIRVLAAYAQRVKYENAPIDRKIRAPPTPSKQHNKFLFQFKLCFNNSSFCKVQCFIVFWTKCVRRK